MRFLKNVHFCSSSRKGKILTTVIRVVFRGLKFEPDVEIEQKGMFCKGLNFILSYNLTSNIPLIMDSHLVSSIALYLKLIPLRSTVNLIEHKVSMIFCN